MTAASGAPRARTLLAGYGAAVILFWLFLRNADWRVLVDGMQSVTWPLVGAAIAVRFASLAVSALRWQVLLSPVRQVRLGPIVAAMLTGMAVSTAVSMQAAEVARPYLLARRERLDLGATFATVAVEWCVDLLGVLVLVAPALLAARAMGAANARASQSLLGWELAAALALAIAGLAGLRLLPRHSDRLERDVLGLRLMPAGWRTWLAELIRVFASGLGILRQPGGLAAVGVYSVLVALLTGVSSWLALMAFGLPLTLLSGFIVLGLVTVGGMIPTPGAVGGFHAVCQLGLVTFFALDRARTVLPVLGLHAVLYVPAAAVGALCFLWDRYEPLEARV
jgi:glycosyltransferase 2 family protein